MLYRWTGDAGMQALAGDWDRAGEEEGPEDGRIGARVSVNRRDKQDGD